MRNEAPLLCAASLLLVSGCAFGAASRHDHPASPTAARSSLALTVDLEPAANCEERFDLGVYRDRAVERVEWDGRRGKCAARQIVVWYLSSERTEAEVLAAIQKFARNVDRAREVAR